MRAMFHLEAEMGVARPRDEVFAFFSNARAVETLTPPGLALSLLTPSPAMGQGARLEYRLRLRGLPLRWRAEITAWDPPHRFVDEQRRGPYRYWRHEHSFEERGGGTVVRDRVDYAVLGGRLVNAWLVEPDLRRVFRHRQQALAEIFGPAAPAPTVAVRRS
jgi:ligand-binding SRPBCC domain-containing protein